LEFAPATRRRLVAGSVLLLFLVGIVLLGRALRRDRVEGHAFDIPSGRDRVVVEVLNGSGENGLARLGTRRLRRMGLDVVYFGNATRSVDSTRVVLRRGEPSLAQRVRTALGAGIVEVALDTLRRVDVSVILGPDFHPDEDGRP
jgi:LytR cell envelope-related transcriptional attenuator